MKVAGAALSLRVLAYELPFDYSLLNFEWPHWPAEWIPKELSISNVHHGYDTAF